MSAMKRSARVLGLREGPKFLSIQNWERLRDSIIQTIQLDPSSGHKSCNNFYTDVNKALDVMKTARVKDSDKNFIQAVSWAKFLKPDGACRKGMEGWKWLIDPKTQLPYLGPPPKRSVGLNVTGEEEEEEEEDGEDEEEEGEEENEEGGEEEEGEGN